MSLTSAWQFGKGVMQVFSEAEYDALYQERINQGEVTYRTNDFECLSTSHRGFYQGTFQSTQLRPELRLEVFDGLCQEAHSCQVSHNHQEPLTAKFYLKGHHRVTTFHAPEILPEYEEIAKQNYLFYLPNLEEAEYYPAGPFGMVRICLDIHELQKAGAGLETLPSPLRQILAGSDKIRFHQPLGSLTPNMQLAIAQILNCPYQGLTRRFFLEAKAMELLALQLEQWTQTVKSKACPQDLPSGEIERLQQARQILLQDLNHPPSLLELARQVGLNDYKLKRGFRQLYGSTVFGCLLAHRMEQARLLLLEQPHLTIAGVAQSVGYASQSRFCHAFKRRFGASPQAYRIAQRG